MFYQMALKDSHSLCFYDIAASESMLRVTFKCLGPSVVQMRSRLKKETQNNIRFYDYILNLLRDIYF